MKIISPWMLITILFVATALGQDETSFPNHGALVVKLTAASQKMENTITSSKSRTNAVGVTTIQTMKSVVTNATVNSAYLLQLLENSMNTNFPAGARLMVSVTPWRSLRAYVTDRTGTNIIQGTSSNLYFATMSGEQPMTSEQVTVTTTSSAGGWLNHSEQRTTTTSRNIVLGYDDHDRVTRDGTHSRFSVRCLLVEKSTVKGSNGQFNATLTMQGSGYGVIRDKDVLLQGSMNAILKGRLD